MTSPLRFLMFAALCASVGFAACGTTETTTPGVVLADAIGGDTDAESDAELDAVGPDTTRPDATGPDATDTGAPGCDTPNPAGCVSLGCDDGLVCSTVQAGLDTCIPSSCECDEATGVWACSEDCGGGTCIPEPGRTCESDRDCPYGAQWCEDGVCEACDNGAFVCDIDCGDRGMVVRNGCHPCECNPPDACGPKPPTGCYEDDECARGETCQPSVTLECLSSECACDSESGTWSCTGDCAPGRCVEADLGCGPAPPQGCSSDDMCDDDEHCAITGDDSCYSGGCYCDPTTGDWNCTDDCQPGICLTNPSPFACAGPNPAGCVENGCPDGQTCIGFPDAACTPSSCFCDEDTGEWACTEDCGGGVCVSESPVACDADGDCPYGAQWCEDGVCEACDNSGFVCRIACPDGEGLVTRNGCHPCECAPLNECESDRECDPWQQCVAGDECLHWCPVDDPSCCYGNRCVDLPD